MKKTLLSILVVCIATISFAQEWALDKSHSNVSFTVIHLKISEIYGSFGKFDAKINSSKEDFTDAVFEFSADVASINTGIERRDNHLKADDYFGAEAYPTLSFKSTSVTKGTGQNYKIHGDLTMKGITKPITLDAVIKGPIEGRNDKKIIGVTVTGEVNRIDFGVGKSGPSADDIVTLRVSGEFSK